MQKCKIYKFALRNLCVSEKISFEGKNLRKAIDKSDVLCYNNIQNAMNRVNAVYRSKQGDVMSPQSVEKVRLIIFMHS